MVEVLKDGRGLCGDIKDLQDFFFLETQLRAELTSGLKINSAASKKPKESKVKLVS